MTTVKIAGKPSASAAAAIERYADQLYSNNTARVVIIAELKHAARNEPAPDEDKDRSVELKISGLEVASPEQDEALRKAMQALYISRTAQGTLDEGMDIELSESTLRQCGDRLLDLDVARMRVGVRHWADYTRRVFNTGNLTATEARHELEAILGGLEALLNPGSGSGENLLRDGVGVHLGGVDDE